VTAYATIQRAPDHAQEHDKEHDCGCGCGCTPCDGGCGLECLERPRFFCGQLLTDADLTALVDWTRARLALVRHRDGWGVVCGLDVRCNPRKPSSVVIGEGYAISCCGSDIVVCEPAVVDLSTKCRPPKSPCDDPCAPAPAPEELGDTATSDGPAREPWDCPEGVWVEILIDATDEEAGGRPTLSTDGCRRIGSCEASRVRETHGVTVRRAAAVDPLEQAEKRWRQRYAGCFRTIDESDVPTDDAQYGDLRRTVEQFALDRGCEGGCRALRWICRPGAPSDETMVTNDVVQRIRLALLLDCLTEVGRCDCRTCEPGEAVMLARVLLVPGRTEDCPCRVVAADDAPPYRRPLGHDCPPAGLGRVNLGDLLGQRPEGVCLEVQRRGVDVVGITSLDEGNPVEELQRLGPPIVDCDEPVVILTADDECLGTRVVGFRHRRRVRPSEDDRPLSRPVPSGEVIEETSIVAPPPSPLLRHSRVTETNLAALEAHGVRTLSGLGRAPNRDLIRVFPGSTREELREIKNEARILVRERDVPQ
jgi:hypothetical protein